MIPFQWLLWFIHSISTDEKNNARKSSAGKIQGELKLSIEYRKDALLVMVHHAKDLAMPDGSKEAPNSYVKVFLNKKVLIQRNFGSYISAQCWFMIEFTGQFFLIGISSSRSIKDNKEKNKSRSPKLQSNIHGNGNFYLSH